MTQHDTPEEVEGKASWQEDEARHLRAHRSGMGSMPERAEMHEETAAMLRRLHTRAMDAERERDDFRMRYVQASADWCKADTDRENLRASLATGALDALLAQAREDGFALARDAALAALEPSDGAMYAADHKAQMAAHHARERVKSKLDEARGSL